MLCSSEKFKTISNTSCAYLSSAPLTLKNDFILSTCKFKTSVAQCINVVKLSLIIEMSKQVEISALTVSFDHLDINYKADIDDHH